MEVHVSINTNGSPKELQRLTDRLGDLANLLEAITERAAIKRNVLRAGGQLHGKGDGHVSPVNLRAHKCAIRIVAKGVDLADEQRTLFNLNDPVQACN